MTALLRSELFRLSRRWMPRVLLLIVAVAVLALYLVLWSVLRTDNGQLDTNQRRDLEETVQLGNVRNSGLALVQQVGGILVVILAASTIGTEFGWGTIRALLPRASSRSALLTAKLITLVLFTALVVLAGFIAALAGGAIATSGLGLNASLGSNVAVESLAALGRTVLVMLPYAAIAFFTALWARSNAAGIGVGLAVLFLEGLILSLIASAGGPLERLPEALLSENVRAVMAANAHNLPFQPSPRANDLPGAWRGAVVLCGYTALFVAAAFALFRRRDVTSG